MTLFANADVRWPNLEVQLKSAGTNALSGASSFWRLLALIEGRSNKAVTSSDEKQIRDECVNLFRKSIETYRDCAKKLGKDQFEKFTPSEIELGALASLLHGDGDYPPYFYVPPLDPAQVEKLFNGSSTFGKIYGELASRIQTLVSELSGLELNIDKLDLSPSIFRMMDQWDKISLIARGVAVANRREIPGK